jgi:hypothetical protein
MTNKYKLLKVLDDNYGECSFENVCIYCDVYITINRDCGGYSINERHNFAKKELFLLNINLLI